jgi:DNA end-binding protein Ku
MRQTGRCALAKWAARGKGYLVLLRPIDNGLVMQVLHYAAEVRQFDEVPVGDAQLRDSEMKLAVQLIEQISTEEFHPENYQDEVRARYQEAIQRKVEGQEVTAAAPEQPRGQIIDLMEALKASLAAKGNAAAAKAAGPTRVEAKSPAAAKASRPTAATAERKTAPRRAEARPKAAAGGRR